MLYLIVGLTCLAVGGFAGYYLGYDDAEEDFFGLLTEEEQEMLSLY